MMKKIKIGIAVFLFGSLNLFSQDLHFSQFNENPSMVNPALTGANYEMRASMCYRDRGEV
jgi:hypothetical protein